MGPIFRGLMRVALAVWWSLPVSAATVRVFAATSLTDSLKEIAAVYERRTGDKIVFNFAASGTLGRQIEEGAPADIFFSADEARMNALEKQGLTVHETRRQRLSNQLVIVMAADHPPVLPSPKSLLSGGVKRLALGHPRIVPAGAYAQAYLVQLGLWAAVEPKVVPCESVRAVLAAVESGNADAGIVYKTDAATSGKVKVILEVPAGEEPVISYPMALLRDSRQPVAAKKFLDYLAGREAGEVFTRRGFILLPAEAKK